MIIGEFTARVRILLEKGLSRYNISEDQKLSDNTKKFIFG
jgi:orotate phosphoribosyltransferase-like protein